MTLHSRDAGFTILQRRARWRLSRSAPTSFSALADVLERRFAAGLRAPWPEVEFDALARAAFTLQFEGIPAYRAFCEARGRRPSTVRSWRDVPPVPATAFKHLELAVAEGPPQALFRTSGTTRGTELRGRHLVPRLSIYRASLLPMFARHVLAARGRIRFVSLIPSPTDRTDSSLSYMVGVAAEALATETHWLVDAEGGLDDDELHRIARRTSNAREPVLLLGTALSLLHALEELDGAPMAELAPGSRIMETGGFKGAGREVARVDLYARLSAVTGVPQGRIVSEYGMTELLSQLYEPVLSEGPGATGTHVAPPWLRVRALDPDTLDEVEPGADGLLCFFDLANAGSICHVLTEDVGSVVSGRVRLSGRARGSEPRGCSIAMDELLTAAKASK